MAVLRVTVQAQDRELRQPHTRSLWTDLRAERERLYIPNDEYNYLIGIVGHSHSRHAWLSRAQAATWEPERIMWGPSDSKRMFSMFAMLDDVDDAVRAVSVMAPVTTITRRNLLEHDAIPKRSQ